MFERHPYTDNGENIYLGCWGKDTESAAIFTPCFASGGGMGEEEMRAGGGREGGSRGSREAGRKDGEGGRKQGCKQGWRLHAVRSQSNKKRKQGCKQGCRLHAVRSQSRAESVCSGVCMKGDSLRDVERERGGAPGAR